jgi:hypothetical protein|tara:strand:+ start:261 stop:569 length:309 start_codon:yes stop_codon:yes gene_type:complete
MELEMEKEMLAIAFFKEGEGIFEKFMGWMQSEEGLGVRASVANVEKTMPSVSPMKNYVMFKVFVHNEEKMIEFVSGNNPIAKPIFDECIDKVHLYNCSEISI